MCVATAARALRRERERKRKRKRKRKREKERERERERESVCKYLGADRADKVARSCCDGTLEKGGVDIINVIHHVADASVVSPLRCVCV